MMLRKGSRFFGGGLLLTIDDLWYDCEAKTARCKCELLRLSPGKMESLFKNKLLTVGEVLECVEVYKLKFDE